MIYLLLSIFFSAFTVSFFKIFEIKKVHTFQAIIVNYLTCSIIGSFFAETKLWQAGLWQADWLLYAAILGCLFIAIFYSIALTAQKISVSTSMVAAKLSVVVPVLMAFFLYHETLNGLKIFGILVSLIAVFFISRKSKSDPAELAHFWYLPLLVFMGSGAIDTLLNFVEEKFIPPFTADDIVTTAFFSAFVLGTTVLVIDSLKNRNPFFAKSVLWGILLGIPNYFSMYFLVKTLGAFPATFIFPINNIGIVAATTAIAVLAFKEKLNQKNTIGILLAIAAIVLIAFS